MIIAIPAWEEVSSSADILGVPPDRLRRIADALLAAPYRAVGPREPERVLSELVLDSLAPIFLGLIPSNSSALIVDLGCGSGLPILPLAAALPGARLIGIDSSVKRIAYAESIARGFDLGRCRFIAERLEAYPSRKFGIAGSKKPPASLTSLLHQADFVLARGMAKPAEVLDMAAAFVSKTASLLIYSTTSSAQAAIDTCSDVQRKNWKPSLHRYRRSGSDTNYALLEFKPCFT